MTVNQQFYVVTPGPGNVKCVMTILALVAKFSFAGTINCERREEKKSNINIKVFSDAEVWNNER